MSSIISGKVRLDVQRVDLAAVLEGAVETVRPAADAKGIRLQSVIDSQARNISGDPNRLQQVFWNLLTNAIKFTPKGGRVQIVLERIHSHLEVSVSDSGEGISAEFCPTFSTASGRRTLPPPAATADWVLAWPSSSSWWNSMAGASMSAAPG